MSTRRTYICLTCTATSLSYPLSLHDALPIFLHLVVPVVEKVQQCEKILFINGIIKLFCEFYGLAVALFHPLCSSIQCSGLFVEPDYLINVLLCTLLQVYLFVELQPLDLTTSLAAKDKETGLLPLHDIPSPHLAELLRIGCHIKQIILHLKSESNPVAKTLQQIDLIIACGCNDGPHHQCSTDER